MQNREEIALKAFLNDCPSEKKEALLQFYSEAKQLEIVNLPDIPIEEETSQDMLFHHIHWSWYLPIFQSYSVKDRKILLAAFNPFQQKNLCHALKIPLEVQKINEIGISFLRKMLLQELHTFEKLPFTNLPPSPLNLLLKIDKQRFTELIDFLSLHDLSAELRQIVETKILKKIYSFLSEKEKNYLKVVAGHKEPYPPAHIDLDKWDQTKKSFRNTLHRIGLSRLANALSGQNPDLIWYVCHQLDIGRGQMLEKLCTNEQHPKVVKWLSDQLQELI